MSEKTSNKLLEEILEQLSGDGTQDNESENSEPISTEAKQISILDEIEKITVLITEASEPLNWGGEYFEGTLTTTSTQLVGSNSNRLAIAIANLDLTNYIYINFGNADASTTSALFIIAPGETIEFRDRAKSRINAIASGGAINYTVQSALKPQENTFNPFAAG